MKNLFLFICLLPILAEAQKIQYSLDLTIKDFTKKAKLEIKTLNLTDSTYSCIAVGGKFKIKGTINEVEIYKTELFVKEQDLDGVYRVRAESPIILCSGKIAATAKIVTDIFGRSTLKMVTIKDDLGINKEFFNYKKVSDSINDDVSVKSAALTQKFMTSSSKNSKSGPAELEKQTVLLRRHFLEEDSLLKINYIRTHPNSFMSALFIDQSLITNINVSELNAISNSSNSIAEAQGRIKLLLPVLQKSKTVEAIHKRIDLYNSLVVDGTPPDFYAYDSSDKEVRVSSFKGKYLYVYFSSSTCGHCQLHLPGLMIAYNKYNPGNKFEMISFCYELSKENFMNYLNIISYPWIHLVDKKFYEWTKYSSPRAEVWSNPNAPSGFLLDPSGKIIGRDLYDEELMAKLKEVMGN